MAIKIQLRRGTASQWTSTDPILALGEVGFETDTGKVKIGTGSTAWTSLGYATKTPTEITSAIETAINAVDTDDVEEGSTNLYFTNERAQDAVGNAVGTGLTYTDSTGAIAVNTSAISTVSYTDAAEAEAKDYSDTLVGNHNLDTTNVHGIADTSVLETTTGAQSKADAAESAANSYTDSAIADLIDSSPTTLDTLNELARL